MIRQVVGAGFSALSKHVIRYEADASFFEKPTTREMRTVPDEWSCIGTRIKCCIDVFDDVLSSRDEIKMHIFHLHDSSRQYIPTLHSLNAVFSFPLDDLL